MKKCTLALGCFWKPEENFKNKPGIIETEVGYAGVLILMLHMKRCVEVTPGMQKL